MISPFDVTTAAAGPGELAHTEYPIEQLAARKGTRFQLGFARMTMHLLPYFKDAALDASNSGLVIMAASETALALPVEVIRQIYADDVHIGEPHIRLLHKETAQEPIMWVRAAAAREYTETVVHDLISRGAEIIEVDWLAPAPTVHARAPLRQLLGYPAAFAGLCNSSGELHMCLSHYATVPPGPGTAA